MSELITWMEENSLEFNKIKSETKADPCILVNVNRIYSRFSDVIRENNPVAQSILSEVISNIKSEKEMYVLMKRDDVIRCFESANKKYPWNTFLRYEE